MNLQRNDASELAVHVALGDDKKLIGKGVLIATKIELCMQLFVSKSSSLTY